jgi:hypothetical protein
LVLELVQGLVWELVQALEQGLVWELGLGPELLRLQGLERRAEQKCRHLAYHRDELLLR